MENPILYHVVDKLYHEVMDSMPQIIQGRDMASAFILGSGGIYSVVKGLQWASKNLMNNIIPNFDEKWLPFLEKACITSMVAVPLIYAIINPEGAKEIWTQHPTYTSGMVGVGIGGIAGAVQDLHKRKLEDSL